jgi:hypothetical protein
MSRKITWLLIALVLAVLVVDFRPQATARAKASPQWEYKVVYRVLGFEEKNFNELGADGWEFVEAEADSIKGNSSRTRYIFKRLK